MGIGTFLDQAWTTALQWWQSKAFMSNLIDAFVILVIGFVGGRIVAQLIRRLLVILKLDEAGVRLNIQGLLKNFGYTGTLSEFFADLVKWSIYVLSILASIYALGITLVLSYIQPLLILMPRIFLSLAIFVFGYIVADRFGHFVRGLFYRSALREIEDEIGAEIAVGDAIGKLSKYTLYSVLIILALDVLGVQTMVLNILWGSFIVGAVVFLAASARDVGSNLFAGIYFHTTGILKKGESIKVGTFTGKIKGSRLLYTELKSGKRLILIPNSLLMKREIVIKK